MSFPQEGEEEEVTRDQLVEHLKYGGIEDPTRGGVPPHDSPEAPRKRRRRDGDESVESDEDHVGKAPPLNSPTVRSRKHVTRAKVAPAIQDDEEPLVKYHRSIASVRGIFKTMKDATLDVKFLNKAGLCPEYFSPSDPIYVSLTFCNRTSSDIHVKLPRLNFPRQGLQVMLEEGELFSKLIVSRLTMVAKKLSPGECHTFAPRQLCAGRNTEGTELENLRLKLIPYWTPAKAGTYKVMIPLFEKEFSFVIGNDGGDVGGACSKE